MLRDSPGGGSNHHFPFPHKQPRIAKLLEQFFRTFGANADLEGVLPKDDVISFQLLVCKALLDPEHWDDAGARETLEQDWVRDTAEARRKSGGGGNTLDGEHMTKPEFLDSLFEVGAVLR